MNSSEQLRRTVYASLLAALTAVGAYLILPIGPVPISLQSLFIYLSGLLLGGRWAAASIAVYLLAGACGLPIFAGGAGGIGRLIGPTGGYLAGYLAAAFVIGRISEKGGGRSFYDIMAMIAGTLLIYGCGILWLKTLTGMPLAKALAVGALPFLPGDAVKIAAAALIARSVRPLLFSKAGAA